MALPKAIGPASPLDPLLLLPLPAALPPDPQPLVAELAAQLHAYIDAGAEDPRALNALTAGMRHATRSAQITVNAARAGSAQARGDLDDRDAELRAAMYELGKVRDAVAECDAYVPEYEALDVVSEDDYLASADPAELEPLPQDPQERHYALTLLRLEAELAATVAREEQLAALTREKDALVRARREVRAKFDAVDVWLADYAKTTNAMASKIRDVTKVTNPPKPTQEAWEGKKEKEKE